MKCPICRQEVLPSSRNSYYPFCSRRCKMADLSKWLSGDYVIPDEPARNGVVPPEGDESTTPRK